MSPLLQRDIREKNMDYVMGSGFGFGFGMFQILLLLMFILVAGTIIMNLLKGIGEWNKNLWN